MVTKSALQIASAFMHCCDRLNVDSPSKVSARLFYRSMFP